MEKQYSIEVRVWVKSQIAQIQILVPPLLACDEKELPDLSEPHFLNCKKAVNYTTSSQGHKKKLSRYLCLSVEPGTCSVLRKGWLLLFCGTGRSLAAQVAFD